MPLGAEHGRVIELPARARVAEQKAAAAHVAAAHELAREEESRAEHVEQDIHVLARRDAPEQHHLRLRAQTPRERAGVADEGPAETHLAGVDVDLGEAAEVPDANRGLGGRRPSRAVITSAPAASGPASANFRAYVSFPRK